MAPIVVAARVIHAKLPSSRGGGVMKIVAIGIALLAVGACKGKSEPQPAPKVAETKPAEKAKPEPTKPEPAKPLTGEALATWYQGCWDSYGAQKWTEFAGCYVDDVTATTLGMPPLNGKPTVLADHEAWSAAFPNATFAPQFTLVSGRDIFSVRWFRGTQTGPLKLPGGDIPATGKKVSMLMLHHAQISDANQVAREWWDFDVGTLLLQLGKTKDPGRAPLDKGWLGAPILVVAKDDDVEHKNAAALKQIYDLLNKRDLKAFYAMIADDVVESFNNSPKDTVGKKALDEENKGILAAFSDMRVDVEAVWAAADYTIEVAHLRGTNDGDFGPIKKTDKKIDWTAIEINQWKDGKVQNSWPFVNGMDLATQLGLAPAPGAAAKPAHR
jgi:predicted ester cyclase